MTRPIARPILQPPISPSPPATRPSHPIPAGKDGAKAPSHSYVTARRLDHIAASLTDRDRAVLLFVAESRLATSKQLVRRFWTPDPTADPARARAARRALKRLADWRVLDALPNRAIGGVRGGSDTLIYRVGVAGRRLLARGGSQLRRLPAPSDRFIRHVLTITNVVVDLHVADQQGVLELIERQFEPACWRAFLGPGMARTILKPDTFVRIGVGGSALEDRWWIEVDLGTEHVATLTSKAARFLAHQATGNEQRDHGIYPRVLWAVPDPRRAEQIAAVLRPLKAPEKLFSICLLSEVVDFLAAEAGS
jgi:Replication-relaxation